MAVMLFCTGLAISLVFESRSVTVIIMVYAAVSLLYSFHLKRYLLIDVFVLSGFLSILVFFLYITSSANARVYYAQPLWLWFIGPLLMYWIIRLWIMAERRKICGDPVLLAITDCGSWAVFAGIMAFGILASI